LIKVCIVYPTDALGIVPGGTDTCIRDILRCAPDDVDMHLVGVTTDAISRPVGRWTQCKVSGKDYKFFPVMSVNDLKTQMKIPLSLQFTLKLIGKSSVFSNIDVLQFNRIEPALSLLGLRQPKVLIIHQNMNVLSNKNSDIRWKYIPSLYFKIEDFIINRLKEVFIVRENAVVEYRQRFPEKADNIQFLPTWMNPRLFYYLEETEKSAARENILNDIGGKPTDKLLIFVGRLDHQKDPLYLIESLAELKTTRSDWQVVIIGDGVLRASVEKSLQDNNLDACVHLLGAQSQDDVASMLRASDLLLLSSAYEGMPRCVVESLGSGVPVVTTKAGEVTLLIDQGKNGYIVEPRDSALFAEHIHKAMCQLGEFKGEPCLKAVKQYRADVVLENLYGTYRHYSKGV
jgi:glycosyltransferase involved in cell wall biosynthesis